MPFEYTPFVNRYVGAISDVMRQGAEARNRAALSVAETQAGAVQRLGDITSDRWRGLGQSVVGGVESYFTDKQEAEDREYTERLRAENLAKIASAEDAREREEQSRALGVQVALGRNERRSPVGNMLALETDAGGGFQRTPLGPAPQPSRFRGDAPPGTVRDAEGNLVRAEPALLPAETVRMDPSPYKTIDSRGLELHDIDKIGQQAMAAGVYDEFRPHLEALEGFNTRRGDRFNEAYADFQDTLKGSLGQPGALMSVAGEAFKHFSSELGESPRFQALVNAHKAGDPAAFEEMVRRDSKTPHTFGETVSPEADRISPYGGVITRGTPAAVRTPLPTRASLALRAAEGDVIAQRALKYWPEDQAGPRASTGSEKQTLAFFHRAKIADDTVNSLEDWITSQGIVGLGRLGLAPNILQSPEGQRYLQAQRAFTEARLRKESGAAIPESEFQNDRQTYFAQSGDTPSTIAQKRQGRAAILSGLAFASGPAIQEFYGPDYEGIIDQYVRGSVGTPVPPYDPEDPLNLK